VIVKLDKSKESSKKLNNKMDIGLNFIKLKGYQVVPEMCRSY